MQLRRFLVKLKCPGCSFFPQSSSARAVTSKMSKFLFTFGVIVFGLLFGYTIQRLFEKEACPPSINMEGLRKGILKTALFCFLPTTVLGAVWTIRIDNPRLATLPFLGVFALLWGGCVALAISKGLGLTRKQTGSFLVCGSFTNIGAVGGLVCYVFLGEEAFGLVPIYRLFEELIYYGAGFPVARLFGSPGSEKETPWARVKKLLRDPLILVTVGSIAAGGVLNLTGVKRPEFYRSLNTYLIPLTTIAFLVPIGMVLKVKRLGRYLRECFAMSLIKFLIVPGTVTSIAFGLGYGRIADGLALKAVLLLSSMPVAFIALVPPTLYDLDVDLANSCWLFTTGLLALVLPSLFLVIRSL